MSERPRILINSQHVAGGASSVFAALGDVGIKWGSDNVLDTPNPAQLTCEFIFRGAVDTSRLRIGHRLELKQRIAGQDITGFSGRIENMQSRLDDNGRLRIRVTASDSIKELRSYYVATEWENDGLREGQMPRIERIRRALNAGGWQLIGIEELPPMPFPSAASFYNSITAYALLNRYLSYYGPQVTFFDSSWTYDDGPITRRIEVAWMGQVTAGDTLTTADGTTWRVAHDTPDGLAQQVLPAGTVLADTEFEASADSILTTAKVSYQTTRFETNEEEGTTRRVTSLDTVTTSLGAEMLEAHGNRAVELESSAFATKAQLREIGRRWLDFTRNEWSPGRVTVPDSRDLPEATVAALVSARQRRLNWWVIHGLQIPTPLGGLATIRGVATGGDLHYRADRDSWSSSMSLTDTQIMLPADLNWPFLSEHNDPRFSEAPATAAGDVTFADFTTITETR